MFVIPAILLGLGGLATWKVVKRKTGMTPERKKVYDAALTSLKDSEKLRTLALEFRKAGLKDEAVMLEKRAALRDLPTDVKLERREAFKKGMKSQDKAAVLQLADAFEKEGATGAAAALRDYAAGLLEGDKTNPTPGKKAA